MPKDAAPLPESYDDVLEVGSGFEAASEAAARTAELRQRRAARAKECRHCKSFKPPRAHHCNMCGRCVVKVGFPFP